MADVDEIVVDGLIRRCGSWPKPEGFVSSFPPTTDAPDFPSWTDDEIRQVLTDPGRRKSDEVFGSSWITNQLSTSACNGHATAGAMSRARYLRGIDDGFVGSGSFVYSKINGGRDQGSSLESGLKAIQQHGTCSQSLCTANMIYPNQQPAGCNAEAAQHKGFKAYHAVDKRAWRTGCAAGYMGICAVHAGSAFSSFTNVNSGSPCTKRAGVSNGGGNHACTICDMRIIDGVEMYLLDNSWSPSWGGGGRAWVTWEHFAQTFGNHDFFLIPSTSEGTPDSGATA